MGRAAQSNYSGCVSTPSGQPGDGFENLYAEPEDTYVESAGVTANKPSPRMPSLPAVGRSVGEVVPKAVSGLVGRDQLSAEERLIRKRARRRVLKRRMFQGHLITYVGVNFFLFVVWFLLDRDRPWVVIPVLSWGTFLALHAWATFAPDNSVEREAERIRRQLEQGRDH